MDRPEVVHVGRPLYWTIRVEDAQAQPVAPTSVSVTVRINNGSASSSGVTITPVSTGVYDVNYNATLLEGQVVSIIETVIRNGKTYTNGWQATVIAIERGMNDAITPAPPGSMSEAAMQPVSVSADGTSVSMPGISDRIAADEYDKANAAVKKKRRGLMFSRLVPGDAVGPRSSSF